MRSDLLLTLLEVAEGSENYKPENLNILEAWGLITLGRGMDLTDLGRRFVMDLQDMKVQDETMRGVPMPFGYEPKAQWFEDLDQMNEWAKASGTGRSGTIPRFCLELHNRLSAIECAELVDKEDSGHE